MTRALPIASLALACLLAIGCVSVDIGEGGKAQTQYRLTDYGQKIAARTEPIDRTLVVTQMPSAGVGDIYSMAYSRATQQRAFYQYATWAERPSTRIAQLLADRLEARNLFESVAMLGHSIGGNVLLNVSVTELMHDVAGGRGRIEVTLELIDRTGRHLVERKRFEASAPVATEDAPGAVEALSRALTQLLDETVAWVERHAVQLPPAPPRAARRR